MKRICIVIVYFGKWPEWFEFFLQGCRYNLGINWIFYTDRAIPENAPENVKFIKGNLENFKQLVSEKLDITPSIKDSYKICDFRPAFGIIFEDYLRDYDFWGYGDIDLIYGDIRKFITEKDLDKYDIISAKKEFTAGHFTLLKNSEEMNNLYKKTLNYRNVFEREDHVGFDEGSWNITKMQPKDEFFIKNKNIQSFTHAVKFYDEKGLIRAHFKKMILEDSELKGDWKVIWHNGKISEKTTGIEAMYIHFLNVKKNKDFTIQRLKQAPRAFSITSKGIFEEKNPYIKNIYYKYQRLKFKLLQKIDFYLGKIGIFLKKYSPKLYFRLKKLKMKLKNEMHLKKTRSRKNNK